VRSSGSANLHEVRRGDLLRGLMIQLNNGLCSEVDMRHMAELLHEVYEE